MPLTEDPQYPAVGDFCDFQGHATYEFEDGQLLVHIDVHEVKQTLTFVPQENMNFHERQVGGSWINVYPPKVLDEEGTTFAVPDGMVLNSLILVYTMGIALTLTAEFYLLDENGKFSGECTVRKKLRFVEGDANILSIIDEMTGRTA